MSRAEDEQILHALYLYNRGHSLNAIARATSLTRTALAKRIARIRTEDSLTEPSAGAYWDNRSKLKGFAPNDPDTTPDRHHGTRRLR